MSEVSESVKEKQMKIIHAYGGAVGITDLPPTIATFRAYCLGHSSLIAMTSGNFEDDWNQAARMLSGATDEWISETIQLIQKSFVQSAKTFKKAMQESRKSQQA